jgi:hypothetical protein
MEQRISLLLPTRGRPRLVQRFLASVLEHAAQPDLIEVIVCVDEDDPASHGIEFPGLKLAQVVVPRQNMGAYNAICLEHATGDISIAVNDDMIIRTGGWDNRIRELDASFSDGIYLAYANDLFKGRDLCTFPIMSRRATGLMSAPYPRSYQGAFIDVHLMDIFKRIEHAGHRRIVYLKDVVFEHVHYRVDATAMDATYAERRRFGDDMNFVALIDLRELDAKRLIGRIVGEIKLTENDGQPSTPTPNAVTIISLCVSRFLFDLSLPFTWRAWICTWMIARYYYSRLWQR